MKRHEERDKPAKGYLASLTLLALGIVYGDIGTSPLYALRESFHHSYGLSPAPENVLGILSLIFWALLLVISLHYVSFIMRADNHGEGGILALTSLVTPVSVRRGGGRWLLLMLGLFGTALLFGDGAITPAISVLSAVEGLEVATPLLEPYVLPITIAILVVLFLFQSRGSGAVGRLFGPVTLLWFGTLAVLGVTQIVREPGVLVAANPLYAVQFFAENGLTGFLVLGSVFLVVTGGEALYADMGHFGRLPIRLGWFVVVLPSLLLNYFGQGALLIAQPEAVENPFYRMVPAWGLYPTVVLATLATVIASQALISGAFSLTMQAVQLGLMPRLKIEHTSAREFGQIYVPAVNWALMLACVGLVLGFRSSSNLAAAYGVAVTMTMAVTTLLFFFVVSQRWKWPPILAVLYCGFFILIDLSFFGANVIKIPQGGWFPIVVAVVIFTFMSTWRRGRLILNQRLRQSRIPLGAFCSDVFENAPKPLRVPGTAIYMSGSLKGTPPALLHNFRFNRVLHETVILLSIEVEEKPRVPFKERISLTPVGEGFYRLVLRFGFMENTDVPKALLGVKLDGKLLRPGEVLYFLGRETLLPTKGHGMALWRERLFALMARNAQSAISFFSLPSEQVAEIGVQVEL